MELLDFRLIPDSELTADVCIVGTGPAGLAIASELSGTRCRVLMIESGDRTPTPEAATLDAIENVGARRQLDQALVRTRAFGGTSWVWNGRCIPLEANDFEARGWIPLSGWPFARAELAPYFARAAEQLGLLSVDYDATLDRALPDSLPPRASDEPLRSFCWQYSIDDSDPRGASRSARAFEQRSPANVTVLVNATATELRLDATGARPESLDIRSLSGKVGRVRANVFVLCAGGIETPRLLLASRSVVPQGVGNQHNVVGRYLLDHPRCTLGELPLPQGQRVRPAFMLQRRDGGGRARLYMRGLALSEAVKRRERLTSCAAWLSEVHAPDDPWSALKRLTGRAADGGGDRSTLRDLLALAHRPLTAAAQVHRKWITGRPVIHLVERLELLCDVEQVPDASSRITLADRADALGTPLARVDWRVGELERRTVQRFGELLVDAFRRMNLPEPQLRRDLGAGDFIDVAHPCGATRMASDPRRGVVDADCRVHGVERLFIASTSVFPTNGHANPTLTLVALALRLADHIKHRYLARMPTAPGVGVEARA
jgi:choline dehydrogenase-like flavoprotein